MMEVMTPIMNFTENVVSEHLTTFKQYPERKGNKSLPPYLPPSLPERLFRVF